MPDLAAADAFVWHAESGRLAPVADVSHVALPLLRGIDRVTGILLENTRRFAEGLPANNALLWGARGMGKSSLVKAVHAHIAAERPGALALVEIHREDIGSLPGLLALLRGARAALRAVLRRPLLRRQRHHLQVAQGRAGKAGWRAGRRMSSSTPPPTAAT